MQQGGWALWAVDQWTLDIKVAMLPRISASPHLRISAMGGDTSMAGMAIAIPGI